MFANIVYFSIMGMWILFTVFSGLVIFSEDEEEPKKKKSKPIKKCAG